MGWRLEMQIRIDRNNPPDEAAVARRLSALTNRPPRLVYATLLVGEEPADPDDVMPPDLQTIANALNVTVLQAGGIEPQPCQLSEVRPQPPPPHPPEPSPPPPPTPLPPEPSPPPPLTAAPT